jgi:hypothetical protein
MIKIDYSHISIKLCKFETKSTKKHEKSRKLDQIFKTEISFDFFVRIDRLKPSAFFSSLFKKINRIYFLFFRIYSPNNTAFKYLKIWFFSCLVRPTFHQKLRNSRFYLKTISQYFAFYLNLYFLAFSEFLQYSSLWVQFHPIFPENRKFPEICHISKKITRFISTIFRSIKR